jgi:cyclophilin family peptidyl-prolyl cis-trans isomerase
MKSAETRSHVRSLLHDAGRCFEPLESRAMLSVSVANPIADLQIEMNSAATNIDLANRFADPDLAGTIVKFQSVFGDINVQLFDAQKPITVENFLRYVDGNLYDNSMIHRSVPGFVVQGGGFRATVPSPPSISSFPPILNEPGIPNTRGTIAMAKLGGNPNSATNQWFFNLADNRSILDGQNGGFTVFGRVLGDGMTVVDAIAAVPVFNADGGGVFGEVPLRNYTSGAVTNSNLVSFSDIGRTSAFNYSVTVGDPTLVSAQIVEGKVVVSYLQNKTGTTTITVRATGIDSTANFIEDTFNVTVDPPEPELFEVVAENSNVGISGNVVLTVNGAVASTVRYWWDSNGNNEVDASDTVLGSSTVSGSLSNSFRIQFPAVNIGINPSVKIIARAENSLGELSPVRSTTISISSLPPTSGGLRITPSTVARGTDVTLSMLNLADPDGSVQAVSYYADTNGNGIYNAGTDLLLSRVTASPFTLTINTSDKPAGNYVFFAIAEDNNDTASSAFASTLRITEAVPTMSGLKSSSVILGSVPELRGAVTLFPSAVPTDRDGIVTRVDYFRDTNGNSILDAADALIGSVATPTPVGRPVVAADWGLDISSLVASVNPGTYRFFARAVDNYENRSNVPTTTIRVNARPSIGAFVVTPKAPLTGTFVSRPDTITFTVSGVTDDVATNGVRKIEIRADRDGNPDDYEVLLGTARKSGSVWTLSLATRTFPLGINRFQAIAFDNFGAIGETSAPVTADFEVRNSIPTMTGIASRSALIAKQGDPVNLYAKSPRDRDGTITFVEYYLDSDRDGLFDPSLDTLLGTSGVPGTFGLIVTVDARFRDRGSLAAPLGNLIFGRAFDGLDYSIAWSCNVLLNSAPTYEGPTNVTGSPIANVRSSVTLEAFGISDSDSGGITSVEFVVRNQDGLTPDFVLGKGTFISATKAYKFTGFVTKPASNNTIWLRITDKNKGVTFVNTNTAFNILPPV